MRSAVTAGPDKSGLDIDGTMTYDGTMMNKHTGDTIMTTTATVTPRTFNRAWTAVAAVAWSKAYMALGFGDHRAMMANVNQARNAEVQMIRLKKNGGVFDGNAFMPDQSVVDFGLTLPRDQVSRAREIVLRQVKRRRQVRR